MPEMTRLSFSLELINHTAMALGAGPLYTNAIMGQGPSTAEREHARKASSTILREDSIRIEESENVSPTDSWSMHYACTTQPPYSLAQKGGMTPRSDAPHLARDHPLNDLAEFLQSTGPVALHRRPSKIEHPSKTAARRKKAMQFFRLGQQRQGQRAVERDVTCAELRDEGGLLAPLPEQAVPKGYEQKVSATGQRYLALQEPKKTLIQRDKTTSMQSPSIVDSRVSIFFTDSINPVLDQLQQDQSGTAEGTRVHSTWSGSYDFVCTGAEDEAGTIDKSLAPIRPPASDPPTPEPLSAISFADSLQTDNTELPTKSSFDSPWPIRSNQIFASTSSSLPLPREFGNVTLDQPQSPWNEKDADIKHPSPRRFASPTTLLQRSSTIASCPRSISDSPGPPPRSPLRLQRESRNIEGIITSYDYERPRPKVAPVIQSATEFKSAVQSIRPKVVTECTGPKTRPKSRESNLRHAWPHLAARREREEQTRARKIRDRPITHNTTPTPVRKIDAIVHAPFSIPRQRLRKARPHIQIPDLRPAPLTMRAPSDASSNASWKKITETTRTPISAVPSESTPTTWGAKTGYTPISPTASNTSATAEAMMALSPVMLIAEEVPIPKVKPSPKPARLVVREGKSFAPRPRSASIPRSALKRRSRHGGQTPSRPGSPSHQYENDEAPPLPSMPPNRALPPTPPASGSERPKRAKFSVPVDSDKDLPSLPADKIISELTEAAPHIASQLQRKPMRTNDNLGSNGINARLEALEKQNALLSAALTAVLRTNGSVNGPLYNLANPMLQRPPMAWQSRMERQSAASHGSSNSNDSAMRMYRNTRREV